MIQFTENSIKNENEKNQQHTSYLSQITENTASRHSHTNKSTLDKITTQHLTQITENTASRHSHTNKSALDTVTDALLGNILYKNNTKPYEPKGMYQPATMKYVDEKVLSVGGADMTKAVYDPNNKATDIFAYADRAAWIPDSVTKTYYRWGVENGKLYLEEITKGGGV